jgi:hypothetical protein
LALGLRRPLQIGAEDFTSGYRNPHAELEAPTKADPNWGLDLAKSLSVIDELGALLRQTLKILASDEFSGAMTTTNDNVQACSNRLDQWYGRAKASFDIEASTDKSVDLQNQVVYIYYQ